MWLFTSAVYCTSKIVWIYNLPKESIDKYDLPNGCFQFDLNFDHYLILYSDSNYASGDIEVPLPPNDSGKIKLNIMNLLTKENKLIKQNIGIDFNPRFIDNDYIEIFDSNVKRRIKLKYNN